MTNKAVEITLMLRSEYLNNRIQILSGNSARCDEDLYHQTYTHTQTLFLHLQLSLCYESLPAHTHPSTPSKHTHACTHTMHYSKYKAISISWITVSKHMNNNETKWKEQVWTSREMFPSITSSAAVCTLLQISSCTSGLETTVEPQPLQTHMLARKLPQNQEWLSTAHKQDQKNHRLSMSCVQKQNKQNQLFVIAVFTYSTKWVKV